MSYVGRLPRQNIGGKTVIQKQEASASSDITFTIPIGNLNYRAFEFQFVNLHPAGADKIFEFQVNGVGESGENETITSSHFSNDHKEDDSAATLGYNTGQDQAQGTDEQQLVRGIGADADNSGSGYLIIYNPSSPTYTKNFVGRMQYNYTNAYTADSYTCGYINTTTPIDNIKFSFDSANIDSGIITMYGIGLSTTEGVYANGAGGTITYSGEYKIHSFTSSATFTCNTTGTAEILIIGGGGGGGYNWGGGGGAGGVLHSSAVTLDPGAHTIVIGAGGAGAVASSSNVGTDGSNTTFDGNEVSITGSAVAIGGGSSDGGGDGRDGGSGGGAGRNQSGNGARTGGATTQTATTLLPQFIAYGSAGGNADGTSGGGYGSGGGGAGAAGSVNTNSTTDEVGDGGAGRDFGITGSTVGYAGGGGGASHSADDQSTASHGGGRGTQYSGSTTSPGSGTDGTGGGGGGTPWSSGENDNAGDGGNGIVIIRYKYK